MCELCGFCLHLSRFQPHYAWLITSCPVFLNAYAACDSSSPTKNGMGLFPRRRNLKEDIKGTKQPWVHHILHLVLKQNITENIVLVITHIIRPHKVCHRNPPPKCLFFGQRPNIEMNTVLGPYFCIFGSGGLKSHSLILKPLKHSCTRTQQNMLFECFSFCCVHLFSSLGFLL